MNADDVAATLAAFAILLQLISCAWHRAARVLQQRDKMRIR